jgi:sugar/nucleoside kinase (ribokinase family)
MKHFDIMTLGVPILEFTRMELDKPFSQAGLFYGPVPAGDPGIAMNACVRLGYTGAYVGATGEDAFADCFFAQMEASGIDVAYLRRDSSHDTALSMLTQFSDGSRDFVFTVPHSAAATLCEDDVCEELLKNVSWIHLSGFALSISESSARAHHKVIALAPQETRISFDPNFRPQVIDRDTYLRRAMPLLERCDCFLPSRGEAALFARPGESEEVVCQRLSYNKAVALKDGSNGSYVFHRGEQRPCPATG